MAKGERHPAILPVSPDEKKEQPGNGDHEEKNIIAIN
jgi:hypothetical protein